MTSSLLEKRTLIDELDSRQDEVIAQLDELNQRIESVIQEWLSDRVDGGEQSVTTIAQSGTAVSV
jgi:predicted transcriptional regulator